ncbi:MAG: hypothetical protein WCF16_06765, partial [Alphaproteobacteria bacterium]
MRFLERIGSRIKGRSGRRTAAPRPPRPQGGARRRPRPFLVRRTMLAFGAALLAAAILGTPYW